jgi:phosphatidyl-myo-inositol alpha-mannosyltransferase
MKVAVVCPYAFDAHGGVQDQVARIVGWLRDSGHDAWAVAPGSGGPDGTRHVGGFTSVKANRSRAPIALNPAVVRRVAAAVEDADVVHIHEPLMPLVSLGALMARTPPKVGTFHADPGPMARRIYRTGARVLRRMVGRLAAVTAVSDVAAAALGSVAEPQIVPNGIDLEAYSATRDRVPGRVLFIGRNDGRKGLDVLLGAWPLVARDSTLHIVGADGDGLALAGVEWLGRVSESDKRRELATAEVLVAPNRGGESFGIVVLEGLASGCAVIASDLPAFRAVAADTASYVAIGDSKDLASEIDRVLGSDDRRREMARLGSQRAVRFGRDEVLAGYLAAYESALADH